MLKLWRLLTVFLLMLSPSVSFGAMTCVDGKADGTYKGGIFSSNKRVARLYVTCTFDTTPATGVDDLPTNAQSIVNNGYYVYRFSTIPGTTGPTENSDLQIMDADGLTILDPTANGKDVIRNAVKTSIILGEGNGTIPALFPQGDGSPWTITVTNNAVNSSSFTLVLQCIREGGDNR